MKPSRPFVHLDAQLISAVLIGEILREAKKELTKVRNRKKK